MASASPSTQSVLLLLPVHVQYLRLLLAVIAVSMVLLAANVSFMLRRNAKSPMLNVLVLTWISALLYGGLCGLVAAFKNRLAMAAHVVACWLLIAVLHVWYLVDGRHRVMLLPHTSNWSLIAQIAADLLCVAFIAAINLLMRWQLKHHPLNFHTVIPMPAKTSSTPSTATNIHLLV